jgi:dienelactone hydrolase
MSCPHCFSGFIDSGTPQGAEEKIADINCYVAPKNKDFDSDTIIVIATDIFGYKVPNVRLIADSFAKDTGFLTIVPDIFNGSEPPANLMDNVEALQSKQASFGGKIWSVCRLLYHLPPFLIYNKHQNGVSIIEKVVKELKNTTNIKIVAVSGYCWGGTIAVLLAQKSNLIDCAMSAHPGGLNLPGDVEKIINPIGFLLTTGKDFEIKEPQLNIIQEILLKKEKENGLIHLLKDYPTMFHGFAVRGNENDPNVSEARKDAYKVTYDFFKSVLKF